MHLFLILRLIKQIVACDITLYKPISLDFTRLIFPSMKSEVLYHVVWNMMKNFALSVQTTFWCRKITCRRTIFTSLIVINYLNWEDLRRAIGYDITQEKVFSYKEISTDTMVEHITRFVSGLWQIHAFCEGNTRTTAVFTILYLRSIGFKIDNSLFARHSWYFRNALVRANYKNAIKGIDYTSVYLERFFRHLLLGEKCDLRNRYLHIHATDEWKV